MNVSDFSARTAEATGTGSRYEEERRLSVLNFLTLEVDDDRICGAFVTPAAEYYPTVNETRLLIEGAGMEIVEIPDGYEGQPFSETADSGDVIMVARPGPR